MRIFILLASRFDVRVWREQFHLGNVADLVPYGYHHAAEEGCEVSFSQGSPIGRGLTGFLRRILNCVLGFDIVHAFNNRAAFSPSECDVVWTHTEREHLAVRMLEVLSLGQIKAAPMISQSVWLMDNWQNYSFVRRFFYKKLLNKSEVLTFLSPLNAEAARREFDAPVEFLPFGVSLDSFKLRSPRKAAVRHPTRIFTLGYDAHRDWETFAAAFGDSPDFEVRVASPNYPKRLIRSNMQVRAMDLSEVKENYAWADVIVVPLTKNLHAFGATVLFEAVILGVPVVISDVGGLRSYFDDDEVNFVPGADPEKLRQGAKSITESLAGAEAAAVRATAAQNRLIEQDYTSRSFARRHVAVSRPLLAYNHYESRSLADRGV